LEIKNEIQSQQPPLIEKIRQIRAQSNSDAHSKLNLQTKTMQDPPITKEKNPNFTSRNQNKNERGFFYNKHLNTLVV